MKPTQLYTNIEGEVDPIACQAIQALQDFGREVLDRDFKIESWCEDLPNIKDFETRCGIEIDAYRQALWDLYHQNRDREIFTLDVVNGTLETMTLWDVFASSVQYVDLNNGELILPDKAGIVVSRDSFNPKVDEEYNQAKAYCLGFHEIGHLVTGDKACRSNECVFSHNYGSFYEIIKNLIKNKKVPVCDFDKKRIEEFKKRWGIKERME